MYEGLSYLLVPSGAGETAGGGVSRSGGRVAAAGGRACGKGAALRHTEPARCVLGEKGFQGLQCSQGLQGLQGISAHELSCVEDFVDLLRRSSCDCILLYMCSRTAIHPRDACADVC